MYLAYQQNLRSFKVCLKLFSFVLSFLKIKNDMQLYLKSLGGIITAETLFKLLIWHLMIFYLTKCYKK